MGERGPVPYLGFLRSTPRLYLGCSLCGAVQAMQPRGTSICCAMYVGQAVPCKHQGSICAVRSMWGK
eukprot:1542003-Pyramimonas_sp.AAC.1